MERRRTRKRELVERVVSLGEYVQLGASLLDFVSLHPSDVEFRVAETDLGYVHTRQDIEVIDDRLAILAIHRVLSTQFESFIMPVSVMLALPFATADAFVGLLLGRAMGGGVGMGGMIFNLFSLIGIIPLMRLVKGNSILLVSYATN